MVDGQRVLSFEVDGQAVSVPDDGLTLLSVLRDQLGLTSPKTGCSPQGQCGCCTVLVDGQPRVACVTPVKRVRNKSITTVAGLEPDRAEAWGEAFCSTGGSQCGYCTPGIVLRLDALQTKGVASDDLDSVRQALLAHLCRCSGWQTITEAWQAFAATGTDADPALLNSTRDLEAAARRSELEGGTVQSVSASVALGQGGFSADTAPEGALIAVCDAAGEWFVEDTIAGARQSAGKTQGRKTTVDHTWPLELPAGNWDRTMRTTWVEPASLETDAAWCEPGGEPSTTVANGGAFGSKADSPVSAAAQSLANEHGRPVLALATREDTVLWGPKRPPIAAGINADGTGVVRVVACEGIEEAIASVAPGLSVEQVEIEQPRASAALRAAGWAEAAILLASVTPATDGQTGTTITSPSGAKATAAFVEGRIRVSVKCGEVLDEVVLRAYCIGAAHMAWSWLTSEALTVNADGVPQDLTIRSFGVLRAIDTPPIDVELDHSDTAEPINGSDAVFAAVAASGWRAAGFTQDWPVGHIANDIIS